MLTDDLGGKDAFELRDRGRFMGEFVSRGRTLRCSLVRNRLHSRPIAPLFELAVGGPLWCFGGVLRVLAVVLSATLRSR